MNPQRRRAQKWAVGIDSQGQLGRQTERLPVSELIRRADASPASATRALCEVGAALRANRLKRSRLRYDEAATLDRLCLSCFAQHFHGDVPFS